MAETRYARSGDINIAYQVVGDGPRDLIYVPGWVSNIEVMWEDPELARFLRRLASFSRLITFDKRGTGLSDQVPVSDLPTLEVRMDDLRAVMDAAGSERAILFGHSEGGNMCALFAATYPDRTEALILTGSYAKRAPSDDYPWAPDPAIRTEEIARTEQHWGDVGLARDMAASRADDTSFLAWASRYQRLSASPKAAAALLRMNTQIDVTSVLPAIRVPTLLLYRVGDLDVRVEEGRFIADRIAGSKLVEFPGSDHWFWAGDLDPMLDEIEEFVTGERTGAGSERILATVLFTDLVASTERVAEIGDRSWVDLLDRHHRLVRSELRRWRGREIDTAGDGFLALFDGPGRAITCATSLTESVGRLGIEMRCGVHSGEIEIVGDDVAGLAIHIGARIAAMAGPSEVLVSRTVKDLVGGSGIQFESRGSHQLKGVPEQWEIYLVR